jgi:glycosyltransferase involved in cell wall biosynthesis
MASLLALTRQNKPHILISHNISSRNKSRLFRLWPLYKSFSNFIFVSKPQERYAIDVLGIHPSRVTFTYDNIDHQFFAPRETESEDFILAIGNEQRDYQTLFAALRGTNLKLVVGASSPWSSSKHKIVSDPNVIQLGRISYTELREVYSRARLVVLPLRDVDYAAGANATLEAMSMGKSLIATESRGLEGYVSHDETGWLVPPGDVKRLRDRILSLWDNPATRNRLGANARDAVVSRMNMQIYVDTITEMIGRSVVGSVQKIAHPVDLLEIR